MPWDHNKEIISILTITLIILLFCIGINVSPIVQGTSSPVGSITPSATSNTSGKIVFGTFCPNPKFSDIRILVYINGTASGYLNFSKADGSVFWNGGPENVTSTYYDLYVVGGTINSGDYIEFTGLSPSTLYTFLIYHMPCDSLVSLVGNNNFGTPPEPPTPSEVTYSGGRPPMDWDYSDSNNDDNTKEDMILLLTIIALFVSIIIISYYFVNNN